MSCGCGKARGMDPSNPIRAGLATPPYNRPMLIRSLVTVGQFNAGDEKWVEGRFIQAWVDKGWAEILEGAPEPV